MLFILWRDTTSELWTLFYTVIIVYHLLTLFTFLQTTIFYHLIRLILCLQQIGEIDNLTISWDKVLGCVVCRFHAAAGAKLRPGQGAIVRSCRKASEHQPSEVGSFSYWFDKPRSHTEGRLIVMLIITFSWGFQLGGHLQNSYIYTTPSTSFLQGESLASNLLLCYCFTLFYFILFCLHLFIKKYKKISSNFKLLFMSSLVSITMSPEEMIFTFKKE
jgi:hypothetical protein